MNAKSAYTTSPKRVFLMTVSEFETVRGVSEILSQLTHEQFVLVQKLVAKEAEVRVEYQNIKKPSLKSVGE